MDNQQFITVVKQACAEVNLPAALNFLKQVDDPEVAEAAQALTGQFMLAEVGGEQRVYHTTFEPDDQGVETEYVEYIMNEGDETIVFVAWFFETQFDMKRKDVYTAAGRTYKQPKRN